MILHHRINAKLTKAHLAIAALNSRQPNEAFADLAFQLVHRHLWHSIEVPCKFYVNYYLFQWLVAASQHFLNILMVNIIKFFDELVLMEVLNFYRVI